MARRVIPPRLEQRRRPRATSLPPACAGVDRQATARFAEKLVAEALLLQALGYLKRDGSVHCPECGEVVERPPGWQLRLACACGWLLEDGP